MVRLTTLEGDSGFSTAPRIGTNAPRLHGWWTDFKNVVSEKASDAVSYTSGVFSDAATDAGKQLVDKAASEARQMQTNAAPLTPYVEKGKQAIPTWIYFAGAGLIVYLYTTSQKSRK
jgi:hypothetical protein